MLLPLLEFAVAHLFLYLVLLSAHLHDQEWVQCLLGYLAEVPTQSTLGVMEQLGSCGFRHNSRKNK